MVFNSREKNILFNSLFQKITYIWKVFLEVRKILED